MESLQFVPTAAFALGFMSLAVLFTRNVRKALEKKPSIGKWIYYLVGMTSSFVLVVLLIVWVNFWTRAVVLFEVRADVFTLFWWRWMLVLITCAGISQCTSLILDLCRRAGWLDDSRPVDCGVFELDRIRQPAKAVTVAGSALAELAYYRVHNCGPASVNLVDKDGVELDSLGENDWRDLSTRSLRIELAGSEGTCARGTIKFLA